MPEDQSMRCNNILEAVGRIPLIRLNRINQGLKPQMWIKAEMLNPGGSVKDRIGITMIDEAEKKGLLKPGGTIIEGTSGNTGMGLALVAAVRGYKCVFTTTDKQSKEKVDLLKALGAEVIVCPPPSSRKTRAAITAWRKNLRAKSPTLITRISTTIRATPTPTTKPPALKSGKTPKAKSRTSFAAWAPAAPSAAWANF